MANKPSVDERAVSELAKMMLDRAAITDPIAAAERPMFEVLSPAYFHDRKRALTGDRPGGPLRFTLDATGLLLTPILLLAAESVLHHLAEDAARHGITWSPAAARRMLGQPAAVDPEPGDRDDDNPEKTVPELTAEQRIGVHRVVTDVLLGPGHLPADQAAHLADVVVGTRAPRRQRPPVTVTTQRPTDHTDDAHPAHRPQDLAPSGTGLRFLLLIMMVLATSSVIFILAQVTIPRYAKADSAIVLQCQPVLSGGVAPPPASFADKITQHAQVLDDFAQCTAPATLKLVLWTLWALAAQTALATILYLLHPVWLRRHGIAATLPHQSDPALATELADLVARSGLRRTPEWLAGYSYGRGGQAFGLPGHHQIRLDVGLLALLHTDRPRFRAVVLHELAHLRNRDVAMTYLTIAIWRSFVATALIPLLALLTIGVVLPGRFDGFAVTGWRLIALLAAVAGLTALVYAARNAVLRTRESYADVTAAATGSRNDMITAIRSLAWPLRRGPLTRWTALRTHPHPGSRLATVLDPIRLHRTNMWDIAGFGLATGVTMANLLLPIPAAIGSTTGSAVVCAVIGAALATFMTTYARKAVIVAHPNRPSRPNWWAPPAVLAAGVSAGSTVSVLAAATNAAAAVATGWHLLAATALLAIELCLLNTWFLSTYHTLGQPGHRSWRGAVLTTAAAALGGVFFFQWLLASAPSMPTAFTLGLPPEPGGSIGWYRMLGQWITSTYMPVQNLISFPLALSLATLALIPALLAWRRPAFAGPHIRYRFAVCAGLVTGLGVALAGVVLPFAARALLPADVRHASGTYRIGTAPFYTIVALYTYVALAVVALAVSAAVVAMRHERLRPALVAMSTVIGAVTAATGLYAMMTVSFCTNVSGLDASKCYIHPIPLATHVGFLDLILAWAVIPVVPATLLGAAAGARWRARRAGPPHPATPGTGNRLPRPVRLVAASLATVMCVLLAFTEPSKFESLVLPVPSAASADPVDPCLLGIWTEQSWRLSRPVTTTGTTEFASSGAIWAFRADGTATIYFGTATVESARFNGQDIAYVATGTVRWHYVADDGTVSFTEPEVEASRTGMINRESRYTAPMLPEDAVDYALPSDYTCATGTLTASMPGHAVTLRRIGDSTRPAPGT